MSCHAGFCGPCTFEKQATCYCKNSTSKVLCGESTVYSCGKKCNLKYACGIHSCDKKCHQHDDKTTCPLDPSIKTTCPCGKDKSQRNNCTDPVELCGQTCLKPLICGHTCPITCHFGDCPTCSLDSDRTCRCGKSHLSIPCASLTFDKSSPEVLCDKLCKIRLPCKRHTCSVQCCPLDSQSHICDRACGKPLSCKSHLCLMVCSHEGECHVCIEGVSFDELGCACGATIIYPPIPCGSLPPDCNRPCRRTRECGHQQLTRHYCHTDPSGCPPCMVFRSRRCACGESEVKNVPCSRSNLPSCGRPCKKSLDCGHGCSRVCHEGGCIDSTHPCVKRCGRVRSCGHVCQYKCHGINSCPENEACRQILKLICDCGNKKKTVTCGGSETRLVKDIPKLVCDESCEKKLKMERMKVALDIDPSNTFLPFAGWQESMVKLAISFPEVRFCRLIA